MTTGNTEPNKNRCNKKSINKINENIVYVNADINLMVENPIQSKHETKIYVNTSVKVNKTLCMQSKVCWEF